MAKGDGLAPHAPRVLTVVTRMLARPLARGLILCGMAFLSIAAAVTTAAPVDLFVTSTAPAASPGGTAVTTIRVGNGGATGTGPVQLIYGTPVYVNIDRSQPLPAECSFLYQNPDRTVPEIISCTLPPVAFGDVRPLVIRLAVHPLAPAGLVFGMVNVLPGPGSADTDVQISNNKGAPAVMVGKSAAGADGRTNLFLTGDYPAIGGSRPGTQTFVVGNNGPATTTAPVTFTFTTPFFVNIDRGRPLPAGCAFLLQDARPNVPEIVQCRIPAGLAPGQTRAIGLPLVRVAGGPVGDLAALAAIRVDDASTDVDPDRSDNFLLCFLIGLVPFAPAAPAGTQGFTGIISALLAQQANRTTIAAAEPPPHAEGVAAVLAGRVDLTLSFVQPVLVPGGRGVQELTIGNRGADATGPVRLVYSLPAFVNVDRARPFPADCDFLYEDTDFAVPEIIECVISGPRRNETRTLAVPLVASPDAAARKYSYQAIVTPVPGSTDIEQFITDNSVDAGALVLPGAAPPSGPGNRADLYLASVVSNIRTDRLATQVFLVGNKGPNATQGMTRVVFSTPIFMNVDRERPLPAGCRFLYENEDPAIPEVVECLLDAGIAPGAEVPLAMPLRLPPGAPSGLNRSGVIVQPLAGSGDLDVNLADNANPYGTMASQLPEHTLRLYLHGADVPGTAGGFTMNSTPTPSTFVVNLLSAPAWFSDPPLVGTFEAGATFQVVTPCVLGLGVLATYRLSATDLAGGAERPLGQTNRLLSLCLLGQQQVTTIDVGVPVSLDRERLRLQISTLLGVDLTLGSGTYLEATRFRGTP